MLLLSLCVDPSSRGNPAPRADSCSACAVWAVCKPAPISGAVGRWYTSPPARMVLPGRGVGAYDAAALLYLSSGHARVCDPTYSCHRLFTAEDPQGVILSTCGCFAARYTRPRPSGWILGGFACPYGRRLHTGGGKTVLHCVLAAHFDSFLTLWSPFEPCSGGR